MKQVKNKLELKLVVLAAGITAAAVYIICVLAYLALPKPAFDLLWKPVFHWLYGVSTTSIVIGLIEAVAYTISTVAVFGFIYNYLLEREKEHTQSN